MLTYAIGDIHGQLELLRLAHARIAADRARTGVGDVPVVHVGDLVDRGPDSRGVLQFLVDGHGRGEPWVTLKGNHDRLFELFLVDPHARDPGLNADLSYLNPRIGGDKTLASYGIEKAFERPLDEVHAEAVAAIPAAHRNFLRGLPTSYRRDEAIYVHAGLRPRIPLEAQDEDDLLWIRQGFLEVRSDFEALVIHGHTALDKATNYGNRVDIDSKAAYGGPLTAVTVEGRTVSILTDDGRLPLKPTPNAKIR